MQYRRRKPNKRQHRPPDPIVLQLPPRRASAMDIWLSLSPNQQSELEDVASARDLAIGVPIGSHKWSILDMMSYHAATATNGV